jgi:hypothetical protein
MNASMFLISALQDFWTGYAQDQGLALPINNVGRSDSSTEGIPSPPAVE